MSKKKRFDKARLALLKTYPSTSGTAIVRGTRRLTEQPGVYFIYRIHDGKTYVGESSNIQRRMVQHFTVKWPSQTIDWAIKNEGVDQFRCGVLEISKDKHMRHNLESKYVHLFNSYYNGYNSTIDGKRKNKFLHWCHKKRMKFLRKVFPGRLDQLKYRHRFKMRWHAFWRRLGGG